MDPLGGLSGGFFVELAGGRVWVVRGVRGCFAGFLCRKFVWGEKLDEESDPGEGTAGSGDSSASSTATESVPVLPDHE